jgi:hypothetical protein
VELKMELKMELTADLGRWSQSRQVEEVSQKPMMEVERICWLSPSLSLSALLFAVSWLVGIVKMLSWEKRKTQSTRE